MVPSFLWHRGASLCFASGVFAICRNRSLGSDVFSYFALYLRLRLFRFNFWMNEVIAVEEFKLNEALLAKLLGE